MLIRTRSGVDRQITVEDAIALIGKVEYVWWYDALPSGDPNRIEVLDLALPAFLDAVPNFKALLAGSGWPKLRASLDAASSALAATPQTTLAEWTDTTENRTTLKKLFQACTGGANNGLAEFGPARCTKLLHKKRPALIPIIDSWQLEAWDKKPEPWSTDDMVDVVFKIKDRISGQDFPLSEIDRRLRAENEGFPDLSAVRIYDILFWELSR